MNDEVRKAVAVMDVYHDEAGAWQTIRQALRDQEEEIARLREDRDSQQRCAIAAMTRSREADALLRSCAAVCRRIIEQDGGILGGVNFHSLNSAIATHLGEKHD